MAKMNKLQNPAQTAQMMKEFEKQNMKMGMTDEMSKLTFKNDSCKKLAKCRLSFICCLYTFS
jgi:hypothetical protein